MAIRQAEIEGNGLRIRLSGDLESGDIINFSFSFFKKLQELAANGTILFDIRGANLKLIKGLAKSISKDFFEIIEKKEISKVAVVLDGGILGAIKQMEPPDYLRLFTEGPEQAEVWLAA